MSGEVGGYTFNILYVPMVLCIKCRRECSLVNSYFPVVRFDIIVFTWPALYRLLPSMPFSRSPVLVF